MYGTRCVYERSFQVFIDAAAFSETRYRRAGMDSDLFAGFCNLSRRKGLREKVTKEYLARNEILRI